MVLKIESPKGLQFVENIFPTIHMRQEVTLMAARDDLLENIGTDKTTMITVRYRCCLNEQKRLLRC